MNNRREVTALVGAGNVSLQFAQEHSDKVAVLDRVVSTARIGMRVLGLASMTALTVMFFRPELTDQVKVMSPFWTEPGSSLANLDRPSLITGMGDSVSLNTAATDLNAAPAAFSAPSLAAQQRVTGWLAKRHRVAGAASKMLVDAAYTTAKETDIDPLLILSVMSVESRMNPFAQSPMGAQGLMQVMTDVHKNKFDDHGGTKAVQTPNANLRVGAILLKESIHKTGSIESGLKRYIGADDLRSDGGYSVKVLGEYARLQAVASGRYVAATKAPAAPANTTARSGPEKSKVPVVQPA
ncbi:LT_Slt70_like domain containing protein [Oxalobacteraceae bacterium]